MRGHSTAHWSGCGPERVLHRHRGGPDGIRLGMSPASTSFAEVAEGLLLIDAELERAGRD